VTISEYILHMTNISHPENEATQEGSQALTAQAKVYAARMRLQSSVDQADTLEGIREIAANLMGFEELALFKIDQGKAALWLYWSFGIDPNKYIVWDLFKFPVLQEVIEGKTVFHGDKGEAKLLAIKDPVNALVPVFVDGQVAAVLVLFRALPQKSGLDAADRELCQVISSCAGRAIEPQRQ
jgi:hypothetical protein